MRNNNTLKILDDAVRDTKESRKIKGKSDEPTYYYGALKQFIKHYDNPKRADGFTRFNGARYAVDTLTKEDVYGELLKNIVKLKAFKDEYNKAQALAVSNYFSPDMHPYEQEEWLFHQIMYYPLDGINEMMSKNDDILNSLLSSFVNSRYYSGYKDEIDDEMNLTEQEQDCLDNIESYYKTNKYKF